MSISSPALASFGARARVAAVTLSSFTVTLQSPVAVTVAALFSAGFLMIASITAVSPGSRKWSMFDPSLGRPGLMRVSYLNVNSVVGSFGPLMSSMRVGISW